MTRLFDGLRLLLGAVLAVTAAGYFLPALVPFLPVQTWEDPMAARLMAAFDASGLLAAAKFIHLAGGALLLVNRAVPFALAATMPVNVCGTYLAVMLESDPVLALLALLLLALNGVLMLAYLPYYQTAMAPGQLADGEGAEPGANYNSLLANPLSGAPVKAYIGGGLVLLAALWTYWDVVPFTNGTTGLVTLTVPALILLAGLVRALTGGKRAG